MGDFETLTNKIQAKINQKNRNYHQVDIGFKYKIYIIYVSIKIYYNRIVCKGGLKSVNL